MIAVPNTDAIRLPMWTLLVIAEVETVWGQPTSVTVNVLAAH